MADSGRLIQYRLYFKRSLRGVQETVIEARDLEQARLVADTWLNLEPGQKFIRLEPLVAADPSILTPAREADDLPAPPRRRSTTAPPAA